MEIQTPFSRRRAEFHVVSSRESAAVSGEEVAILDTYDAIYRSLCAVLYNFAPSSGHPGGSISSGRFVSAILYDILDFDFSVPIVMMPTSFLTQQVTKRLG